MGVVEIPKSRISNTKNFKTQKAALSKFILATRPRALCLFAFSSAQAGEEKPANNTTTHNNQHIHNDRKAAHSPACVVAKDT